MFVLAEPTRLPPNPSFEVGIVLWTPGRVADAFAAANGDPNKIPNILHV